MTNQRICQFHLTSTKDAVVEHHPQATSKFAKEQGTIVLRFEGWVGPEARQAVVDAMNAAKIGAGDLHGGERATSVRVQERE